jgi:hypothetical protein
MNIGLCIMLVIANHIRKEEHHSPATTPQALRPTALRATSPSAGRRTIDPPMTKPFPADATMYGCFRRSSSSTFPLAETAAVDGSEAMTDQFR